jgi:hypothetical protein
LDGQRLLAGSALFLHEASPCRLDYSITCTSTWETVSASVQGWIGQDEIHVAISVDASHRWRLNGTEVSPVAGSFDLDLNFSPSTNLLPIRRLNLDVGQSADVTSAWLRFPSFRLEPLIQTYRRLAESVYRYESAGGSFVRDLTVNEAGLVTQYPGFWTVEEPT